MEVVEAALNAGCHYLDTTGEQDFMLQADDKFGQAYAEAFKEAAAEVGIEIVAEETIDTADSGAPSGQMTNLAEANPDTILAVPLGLGLSFHGWRPRAGRIPGR